MRAARRGGAVAWRSLSVDLPTLCHSLAPQVLSQDKEHFAQIAVDAVMKLRGSTNLDQIQVSAGRARASDAATPARPSPSKADHRRVARPQIIKRIGGTLKDSYLDPDGFLLDKRIGVGCPKRMTGCKVASNAAAAPGLALVRPTAAPRRQLDRPASPYLSDSRRKHADGH